jgi:hypothetical protein
MSKRRTPLNLSALVWNAPAGYLTRSLRRSFLTVEAEGKVRSQFRPGAFKAQFVWRVEVLARFSQAAITHCKSSRKPREDLGLTTGA